MLGPFTFRAAGHILKTPSHILKTPRTLEY